PKNPDAVPVLEEFVNSLRIEGDHVVGVMPKVPKGYNISFGYKDISDGRFGNRDYDVDMEDKYVEGGTFRIPFYGEGGKIIFGVAIQNQGVGSVVVYVPSLTESWSTER